MGDAPSRSRSAWSTGWSIGPYLGAFDAAFANERPGKLLTEDVAMWCHKAGFSAYDLLAPATDFKQAWTDGRRQISASVIPLDRAGWLARP